VTPERDAMGSQSVLAGWIAASLRAGTLAAVALIGIGYAWATIGGDARQGERAVIREIAEGGGDSILAGGLLALTLVPIAVLVVAAIAFRRAGERRMVATTVLVGALLVASLVAAAVIGPAI